MSDGRFSNMPLILPASFAAAAVIAILLHLLAIPNVEPREPPLVKPRIPLIGHIIGLIRYQAEYHMMLRRRTQKPIATLPMLNGKMYAIWDPTLVAAGLRSKHLSTTPQIISITKPLARITDHTDAVLKGADGEKLVQDVLACMPPAFVGESLKRMNGVALSHLEGYFNGLANGGEETVPSVWMWIRQLMAEPTGKAVFGNWNPFVKEPGFNQAIWDLEHDLLKLTTGVLPSVIAPAGHRARALIARVLTEYYSGKNDQDPSASVFVGARATALRNRNISDEDIGKIEMMVPFAALTNTVPSLFWLFSFIVSRPDLMLQLRDEVERGIVKREGDEVTVTASTSAIEERCPLLWACYRETLRTTVHQVSSRVAMQDVTLNDAEGRQYLLKKDAVVQMSIGSLNELEEYWGPNPADFEPTRFLDFANRSKAAEGRGSPKAMRAAFIPFGGGLHLCPGRMFAAAEMMAFTSTMLLGYDVEPLDGKKWNLPPFGPRSLIDAVAKPANNGEGFGIRIRRRQGWENVRWKYAL
ncbi:cytochrome P450 [Podospora aff. communis PSN243]|uniref:Cytochrome P450 n=1 Tax=Podospora aff. communis PSN243 TaxID=3040156 RepID=A0AAV9GKL8_9PEZI|nr:cytochrome P450 [Podospora aff. communis PSN243]